MRYLAVWWELLVLCARRRPGLTALVLGLQLAGTLSFVSIGLALKFVVDAAEDGDDRLVVIAAITAAVAFAGDWVLGGAGFSMRIHLVEKIGLTHVEPEILRALSELDEVSHLEQPEFLDRITSLRGRTWAIVDSAWAAVESCWLVLRLLIVLLLLGSVSPWLLLLVPCTGVQLLLERRGRKRIRAAFIESGEDERLQRHLFEVGTGAGSSKEVRVAGATTELVRLQREATDRMHQRRMGARIQAASFGAAGWGVFAVGFTACLALVARDARQPGGSLGDVVLALTVGSQLRMIVEAAVRRSTDAAGAARILEPFLWLRDYAAEHRSSESSRLAPPSALVDGIVLDDVRFTYPGTEQPAVDGVSVRLPAGSVVAIVGEYGSGKSTLVKLLAKMYAPGAGRITVDGTDLAHVDTVLWRAQMSAAFQDFGRYQTVFSDAVGLGDPARMDDDALLTAAVIAADAELLRERLPDGANTELGLRFGGVELSEGQWQRVALARACMRTAPLLFVLDEPTASLDAPSEHAIFERYSARARAIAESIGAITVIVSHRFSTVADADLILVMERGRLIEHGSHPDLLARDGTYAALFGIQAGAYATR